MQINENYLTTLLSSILLFICSYTFAVRGGLHSVDGTNSIIYTSPLSSGFNVTNLINIDHGKPLNCLTTLDLESSWILIDLGFIVSGIAQLRLYGDQYNGNIHNYLSNIEIKMAQIVTSNEISNSFPHENMIFKTCGTTGTVSKDTSNVVVDCIKGFDARWILLKKSNILSLCFINILQNTVKPKCFRQILPQNKLFPNANANFNVFKFTKGKSSLNCFQDCFIDNTCQATEFTPFDNHFGICKLLKSKTINYQSKCDEPCILSVNLCQLGKPINIGPATKDILKKLPSFSKTSFALSVEINGKIHCNENDCGETEILLIDFNGKMNSCNKINSLKYKVLVKENFICDKMVKNPIEIILKTRTKNQSYKFRFDSIILRISEENSFEWNIFSYFHNEKTSTKIKKTTLFTTETSKVHTKQSTKLITDSSVFSTNKIKNKFFNYQSSKTTKTINFPSTINLLNTTEETKSSFKSTISISNKQITSKPISTTKNKIYPIKTNSVLIKKNLSTTFIKTNPQFENRNFMLRNNNDLIISTVFTKSSINLKDNRISSTKFQANLSESLHLPNQSTSLPYNWIILVIFIGILILVTLIVLLITFLESRRKKKEWEIPPNGLFPMDQISEQITLQSSLHESTIRKVS